MTLEYLQDLISARPDEHCRTHTCRVQGRVGERLLLGFGGLGYASVLCCLPSSSGFFWEATSRSTSEKHCACAAIGRGLHLYGVNGGPDPSAIQICRFSIS